MADGTRATVIRVKLTQESAPIEVATVAALHLATRSYPLAKVEHNGRWIPVEKKYLVL